MGEAEVEELVQLRSNADNLSQCLDALRSRIEQLESQNLRNGIDAIRSETTAVDPVTGIKKRTIITEKLFTSRTYHASVRLPPDPSRFEDELANQSANGDRLLGPAYEARIVAIDGKELSKIEVESICGEFVVIKVPPNIASLVHPGDTILEVNGESVERQAALKNQVGCVKLKLVLSTIYTAPMDFCRVLDDFRPDNLKSDPYMSFGVRKGDILQVMSRDNKHLQARKVNDLSRAGFVPSSINIQEVAMLCPYGRRVLALLGAPGVGRRTLKALLLAQLPNRFATVIPYTSRAPRSGEQEGREYHFETKERLQSLVRDKQMIEWGEHSNHIYGTTAASVRSVVRSGRVCVLDCAAQALDILYNGEFMPYVVVVAPPKFEELQQMCKLRGDKCRKTEQELRATVEQNEKLLNSEYSRFFDLVLVNRNHDITFRRLLDALDHLKNEPQWVPVDWLR